MSIDDFIIDRVYQKITNRVADVFGRSCYWLARQAAFAGGGIGIVWTITTHTSPMSVVFFIVCQLLFISGVCFRSGKAEKAWRAGNVALDNDRIADRWLRYSYLFCMTFVAIVAVLQIIVELTGDLLGLFSMIGIYSAMCFMACYPRTPRRRPAKVPIDAIPQGAR